MAYKIAYTSDNVKVLIKCNIVCCQPQYVDQSPSWWITDEWVDDYWGKKMIRSYANFAIGVHLTEVPLLEFIASVLSKK